MAVLIENGVDYLQGVLCRPPSPVPPAARPAVREEIRAIYARTQPGDRTE